MSIFCDIVLSAILSKYVYMALCVIANGFRDRAVSLYSCKIVDKETLRIVSNIGIYCSRDKVGTVQLVRYVFENSTVNISAICNSCEDMACCLSECIWTFPYAGDNVLYEIEKFVSCIHLKQPTDASHRFTCFIQWRSTAGLTDSTGRQTQTPVQ
jgi:hypothetical protein